MLSPRKSTERLSWTKHHMLLACLTAQRSPDPNTQVGAAIIDPYNRIVGLGYNGPPRGIKPEIIPWEREGEYVHTKYPYIQHAEKNAIANSNSSVVPIMVRVS